MSVSILDDWLAPLVGAIAVAALALALGWRGPRWRLFVMVAAASSLAALCIARAVVGGRWILQPNPPLWIWLVAAVPPFTAATIPAGWRSATRAQRWMAVPALLLCTLASAGFINDYYGYYPTVGAALGVRPAHEVTLHALRKRGLIGPQQSSPTAPTSTTAASTQASERVGRVVETSIPGSVSGFRARRAWVYLPPAWFRADRPALPVVVLLEGTPGSPRDWIRAVEIQAIADRFAATHGGFAPILVAVDQNGSFTGDTECVDRPGSESETYVTVDVRAYMIKTFGASPLPSRWALEGYSEGGTCALTLALRHHGEFGSFVDIGGEASPSIGSPARNLQALFGGSTAKRDRYDPALLLQQGAGEGLAAWFEVGSSDHHGAAVGTHLAALARAGGADVVFRETSGGHTFSLFRSGFADSFGWLCAELGL